jgi:protein-tyrosine phosphatase
VSDWFERYGRAEVADGLVTGSLPSDAQDVEALAQDGISCVLNLCEDTEYEDGERAAVEVALRDAGIRERRVELVDYGGLLPGAIELAATQVAGWLDDGERVYLHCRAGWQRSATVAAAAIALRDGIEPEDALAAIKRRKPSSEPLPHQLQDLRRWWRLRAARGAPKVARDVPKVARNAPKVARNAPKAGS